MKRWSEYKESEIVDLKKRQCCKCEYYSMGGACNLYTHGTCNYILIHKKRRGCSPFECKERGIFKPRTRRRRRMVALGGEIK